VATSVVVPIDGSQLAERALPYAIALARAAQASLLLVHVQSVGRDDGLAWARCKLIAEEIRAQGLDAESVTLPIAEPPSAGAVADAISAVVHLRQISWIVMATRGQSGAGRWLRGGVAERVLRRVGVPVWLVSPGCTAAWQSTRALRILVPLDGSSIAEAALSPARGLAALFAAELVLIRSVEPWTAFEQDQEHRHQDFYTRAELAPARRYLEDVATDLRTAGVAVRTRGTVGNPTRAILSSAAEEGVGLIVMATHGRSNLARLAVGSVALQAVQEAACPVVLVRAAAGLSSAADQARGAQSLTSSVTITVSRRELDLIERGLGELLYPPDAASRHADEIRVLVERLGELDVQDTSNSTGPASS
jgi:nucleotide-binding universal stress UspA family protein